MFHVRLIADLLCRSIIRVDQKEELNKCYEETHGYLPHSGAHYPLPCQRNEPVAEEKCPLQNGWCLIEDPKHFFAEAVSELKRVEPNEKPIKEGHKTRFGFAPRKRNLASRTTPSKRLTSAEKTWRPNVVIR
jgi:hypothetical protein